MLYLYKFIFYFKKMPIRFYTANRGGYIGDVGGRTFATPDGFRGGSPPLRFQNSFSMALKNIILKKIVVPKSGFFVPK